MAGAAVHEAREDSAVTMFSSRRKHHAVYLVATLPWLFMVAFSQEYGGAGAVAGMIVYSVPVVLCLLQFVFPTRIGWLLALGLQLLATGSAIWFVGQVFRLLPGDNSLPGTDLDDRVFFVAILVLLCTITVLIARRRPVQAAEHAPTRDNVPA